MFRGIEDCPTVYIPSTSGGSDGKESTCRAGDLGSIPGLGRFPGKENSYWLQYSCLENSMDRGAWQATVHGVAHDWATFTFHTITPNTVPELRKTGESIFTSCSFLGKSNYQGVRDELPKGRRIKISNTKSSSESFYKLCSWLSCVLLKFMLKS